MNDWQMTRRKSKKFLAAFEIAKLKEYPELPKNAHH